jgi:hypothetical protein
LAKEIGAKGLMGQSYFDLGLLYGTKKENDLARDCMSKAVSLFEECGAEFRLEEAKLAMASYI